MSEDDPVTGRRVLTESAYRDDRHIRSRMAIYRYAEGRPDPAGRTGAVDWDGTQVMADVGCGNGFDLRRLVSEGRCRHAFGVDLSAGMLHTLTDLRETDRLTLLQGDAQRLPLRDDCVDVALAMHMLYHVPDIQAAVRELRRIVRPGGTVLASTNSVRTMAEMNNLLGAAISAQTGRPTRSMGEDRFNTENGAAALGVVFSDVTLRSTELRLSIPAAQPVVDYLASVRDPVTKMVGDSLDYDAVLDDVAARVTEIIEAEGAFRTASRGGVFVCR